MHFKPFALERFFAEHEFRVEILACSSDPEAVTMRELYALEPALPHTLEAMSLGYTESLGHPKLREALAKRYERTGAEQVLVASGAEEPIYAFMRTRLQPGDHVIVHFPAYQSLYEIAEAAGAQVSRWTARESDRWQLDPDALAGLVRPNTRGIVINSPHNPTGAVLERERFDAIITFARKHGLWLFSDEVYRGLEHDPARRNPCAADVYEHAVSLGAFAKTLGLAGLRLGWMATHDKRFFDDVAAYRDYLTICSSGPSEQIAIAAMKHADALEQRARDIVLGNLALADGLIAQHPEKLSWVRPEGGTMGFPRVEHASALCKDVLEQRGVLLLPGQLFEFDDQHLRLGLGRRNFREAVERLRAHWS